MVLQIKEIEKNLKPHEVPPLVVNLVDIRDFKIDQAFVDSVREVRTSLDGANALSKDVEELIRYKGGYLTYIMSNIGLEDLKDSLNQQEVEPKYQFILEAYGVLSQSRIGGGFAKEFEGGPDSVLSQVRRHPLYTQREKRMKKTRRKKKLLP